MKKIILQFGAPKDITDPGLDGVVIRFPFTAVDAALVGTPEERQHTTTYRLKIAVSRWVTTNWKIEENTDLVKVIFEVGKRQLIDSLRRGKPLRDEFEVKITTQTHSSQLPYDPNRLEWPDGLKIDAELSEPNTSLEKLDDLKAKWLAAQPLKTEDDERLWKKFRLEWNYHSNHIEGNTLTYGETELLLIQGQTAGNHMLREYVEMKAHDVAVGHIRELAKTDPAIGETDIRNLNKIILKEPFWKDALTTDGRQTRIMVMPGEYKQKANTVRTQTGELVNFASPTETPARMEALVKWLRSELQEPTMHPVEVASKLHHEFVSIHPFDDGNGRVARLLVNYVLMRHEFTPIIVKSPDKAAYIAALRQADVGQIEALNDYLTQQLEWSLDVALKASRSESIEEISDVEKEISLFIQEEQANPTGVKMLSKEVAIELYRTSWMALFSKFDAKMRTLSPLFSQMYLVADGTGSHDWRPAIESQLNNTGANVIGLTVIFRGYTGRAPEPFNLNAQLRVSLDEFRYRVFFGNEVWATKKYSESILSDEAETITSKALGFLFDSIKSQAKAK